MPLAGKMPVKGSEGWQAACVTGRPFDPAEYPDGCNAGILTGPASGVLVLDVDDKELFLKNAAKHKWTLPPTLEVITGGGKGKTHHYYRYPRDGREYGNLGRAKTLGFDGRGVGGYVVAEESIHPDTGHAYKLAFSRPLADPPEWLLKLYDDRDVPQDAQEGPRGLDVDALPVSQAVKDFIVNGAPKGQRSELFFKMMCSLLGIGVGTRDIVAMLEQNPGGEKFREQGRGRHRWLEGEIRRAKAHIAASCDTSSSYKKESFSYIQGGKILTLPGNELSARNDTKNGKTDPKESVRNLTNSHTFSHNSSQTSQKPPSDNQRVLDEYRASNVPLHFKDVAVALALKPERVNSACAYWAEKGELQRVPHKYGCYQRVLSGIGFVDYKSISETETVPLWLPCKLDKLVNTYPGSIIGIAGETGAGKTTLAINILRKVDDGSRPVVYLNSELTPEWHRKLAKFEDEPDEALRRALKEWTFKLVDLTGVLPENYHQYIVADAVNIIDWFVLGGNPEDYARVNSYLQNIKKAIGNGIAIVCFGMRKGAEAPQGGDQSILLTSLYLFLRMNNAERMGTMEVRKVRSLKRDDCNPMGQKVRYRIYRETKFIFEDNFEYSEPEYNSTSLAFKPKGER